MTPQRPIILTALLRATALTALAAPAVLNAPALAQSLPSGHQMLAPDESVMGKRLNGVWRDNEFDYIFEPVGRGNIRFRKVRRKTQHEEGRGILEKALSKGLMRGTVSYKPDDGRLPHEKEFTAWVDDRNRLWMDGYNAGTDRKFFQRAPQSGQPDAQRAWVGKWRTSRGMLEILPDGDNFVAWITHDGEERRERVAFSADASTASGAWDSEFDSKGTWLQRPARWGDLRLTLSADGNSFTGTYSSTRPSGLGLDEKSWTGERVDRRPGTSQPQPNLPNRHDAEEVLRIAQQWPGKFLSSEGSRITMRRAGGALVAEGVGSRGSAGEHFSLSPVGQNLLGTWSAGRNQASLEVNPNQPVNHIGAQLTAAGTKWPYTLCRVSAQEELVHSTGGTWVALRDTALRRESDGSTTLFVKIRVLNANNSRQFHAQMLSARLPQHSQTEPAHGYYNSLTDVDDGPLPSLSRCGEAELNFRFKKVSNAVRKLVVHENQGDTAEFDISSVTAGIGRSDSPSAPSAPQPAPSPPAPPAQPNPRPEPSTTTAGFKPLRKFDVRVNRVVSARDAQRIDVFMTVKNATPQPQYIPSGTLQVMLEDSDGVAKQNGQVLRPTEAGREHFASTPVVAPGRELEVKYSFHPDIGTSPARVIVMEGDKSADFGASF